MQAWNTKTPFHSVSFEAIVCSADLV